MYVSRPANEHNSNFPASNHAQTESSTFLFPLNLVQPSFALDPSLSIRPLERQDHRKGMPSLVSTTSRQMSINSQYSDAD
jgi:hypothetical protein